MHTAIFFMLDAFFTRGKASVSAPAAPNIKAGISGTVDPVTSAAAKPFRVTSLPP